MLLSITTYPRGPGQLRIPFLPTFGRCTSSHDHVSFEDLPSSSHFVSFLHTAQHGKCTRLLDTSKPTRHFLRSATCLISYFVRTTSAILLAFLLTVSSFPASAAVDHSSFAEVGLPSIVRVPDSLPGIGALSPGGGAGRRQKTSFVTAAVNSVGPAVVRIDTERLVDRQPLEGYLFPGLEPDVQRREAGQGSGVILNEDGYILTNAHVVKNAAKVTVTLTDGRIFEGLVKGQDDYMDLASVKIKPTGRRLPTAPLGRSDELQVGDWVIAIGNAVGLDSTVTLGIISSLSRSAAEVGIPNKKVNFIQTDAAINPGNSGGPLLNEFGEVIGINTAIRANAAGIGFAIPIDTAERAMRELSQGRKIAHAYLGISMSTLTVDSAKQNNGTHRRTAHDAVSPRSATLQAGLSNTSTTQMSVRPPLHAQPTPTRT